jgi:hypothetical protein
VTTKKRTTISLRVGIVSAMEDFLENRFHVPVASLFQRGATGDEPFALFTGDEAVINKLF